MMNYVKKEPKMGKCCTKFCFKMIIKHANCNEKRNKCVYLDDINVQNDTQISAQTNESNVLTTNR